MLRVVVRLIIINVKDALAWASLPPLLHLSLRQKSKYFHPAPGFFSTDLTWGKDGKHEDTPQQVEDVGNGGNHSSKSAKQKTRVVKIWSDYSSQIIYILNCEDKFKSLTLRIQNTLGLSQSAPSSM